jgi:DNA-binding winged helix-turn-helix (wHTH) protein
MLLLSITAQGTLGLWRSTLSHWYPAMQETCEREGGVGPVFPGLRKGKYVNVFYALFKPMGTIYKFGPFDLDADAGILFRDAEPTRLGQRAVSLLRLLLERAGAPVSKDALLEAGWPAVIVEESNLTVQIAALRGVFEEEAGGGGWIETLPRRGYRYIGPPVATDQATRQDDPAGVTDACIARQPIRRGAAVFKFERRLRSGVLRRRYD